MASSSDSERPVTGVGWVLESTVHLRLLLSAVLGGPEHVTYPLRLSFLICKVGKQNGHPLCGCQEGVKSVSTKIS